MALPNVRLQVERPFCVRGHPPGRVHRTADERRPDDVPPPQTPGAGAGRVVDHNTWSFPAVRRPGPTTVLPATANSRWPALVLGGPQSGHGQVRVHSRATEDHREDRSCTPIVQPLLQSTPEPPADPEVERN